MKTLFAFVLMTSMTSMASASGSIKIECGDFQKAYIATDLSQEFKDAYLSRSQAEKLEEAGFTHAYAGRNCGLDRFDNNETSYEVVLLTKKRKLVIEDALGALGIVGGEFSVSGNLDLLKSGVVLSGQPGSLSNTMNTVQATLETKRASDSSEVLVIIRKAK